MVLWKLKKYVEISAVGHEETEHSCHRRRLRFWDGGREKPLPKLGRKPDTTTEFLDAEVSDGSFPGSSTDTQAHWQVRKIRDAYNLTRRARPLSQDLGEF